MFARKSVKNNSDKICLFHLTILKGMISQTHQTGKIHIDHNIPKAFKKKNILLQTSLLSCIDHTDIQFYA